MNAIRVAKVRSVAILKVKLKRKTEEHMPLHLYIFPVKAL